MLIICPNCNYNKQIDPNSLPPGTTRATCPRCQQSFLLEHPEEVELPVAPEQEIVQPAVLEAAPDQTKTKTETLPKAGFWIRVVATLVDGALVFGLQFGLGLLLAMTGFAVGAGGESQVGSVALLVQIFGFALSFAYYVVFTGHCGQTPGKMALRIKVIRRDGSQIGYGYAAYREIICKFISGIILGIGYLMVAFDEQKQGLHDRMADTYVIKL